MKIYHSIIPLMLLLLNAACTGAQRDAGTWWQNAAADMVAKQIEARGVADTLVLKTMRETPRHLFVPRHLQRSAYSDRPLPIGEGQTISQPYIVALMTELLQLTGAERVLEIGTGSGYQAAILAPLAREVYTIEIVEVLADSATARLARLGYDNVTVKWGDGYRGWPRYAPFDRIIVTAAPDEVPPALVEQLAPGGILVLPVGVYHQQLRTLTKNAAGVVTERPVIPVRFVPMVHPTEVIPEERE